MNLQQVPTDAELIQPRTRRERVLAHALRQVCEAFSSKDQDMADRCYRIALGMADREVKDTNYDRVRCDYAVKVTGCQ
jgi:hypothetical protein